MVAVRNALHVVPVRAQRVPPPQASLQVRAARVVEAEGHHGGAHEVVEETDRLDGRRVVGADGVQKDFRARWGVQQRVLEAVLVPAHVVGCRARVQGRRSYCRTQVPPSLLTL